MYSLHYEHGSLVDDREPSRYVKHIQGSFFWFDDLDGRSFVINLDHLQGVRFLWDVAVGLAELGKPPDEEMRIALVGKEVWSEYPSEDPREVFRLFSDLELGGSNTVTFNDADGEDFTLFTRQIVYLSSPTEILDEGRREVEEEAAEA